jgi:hypothetical protein
MSESKRTSSVLDAQQPVTAHDRSCLFEAQTSQTDGNLSLLHALARLVSQECTKSSSPVRLLACVPVSRKAKPT